MAAEWNHCLSTGGTEALLAVTQTEYKLRYAPRAPTFIVETCEQALWKEKKKKSTQRSRMKPPMCWFFFFCVCDTKKYLWSLIIFLGGGVRVHRWIKSCLMRQLSRCQNSSNYSGVHERRKKKKQSKETHRTLFIHIGSPLSWKASICYCRSSALRLRTGCSFRTKGQVPFRLSACLTFIPFPAKALCVCATKPSALRWKVEKKRSSALISTWNAPQGQQERKIANSVLLIKWRLGEIWNPSLDADDVFSPQHCGGIMWRYDDKYYLSFSMQNARAKVWWWNGIAVHTQTVTHIWTLWERNELHGRASIFSPSLSCYTLDKTFIHQPN